MDSADLPRFFDRQWEATAQKCERTLDPDDKQQAGTTKLWKGL